MTPTLADLLAGFERSAFHLEALDYYAEVLDLFERYLAGEPSPPADPFPEWLQLVRDARAAGKDISRVHAISGTLSPYTRFELDWGYPSTEAAGERIFILHRPDLAALLGGLPLPEFWLFDDQVGMELHFDEGGRFQGETLITDPAVLDRYRFLRDTTLAHAVSLRDYLSTIRHQSVSLPALEAVA